MIPCVLCMIINRKCLNRIYSSSFLEFLIDSPKECLQRSQKGCYNCWMCACVRNQKAISAHFAGSRLWLWIFMEWTHLNGSLSEACNFSCALFKFRFYDAEGKTDLFMLFFFQIFYYVTWKMCFRCGYTTWISNFQNTHFHFAAFRWLFVKHYIFSVFSLPFERREKKNGCLALDETQKRKQESMHRRFVQKLKPCTWNRMQEKCVWEWVCVCVGLRWKEDIT